MAHELANLFSAISKACLVDENRCIDTLTRELDTTASDQQAISAQAAAWIANIRKHHPIPNGIEALLLEYPLSKPEGIALMCLAEALLRIPDKDTADQLIRDLLNPLAWEQHLGHSDSLFVNAASWGLALSGRWLHSTEIPHGKTGDWLRRLATSLGEPVLRQALMQAMRYLANQFVLGENLPTALLRANDDWHNGATHSFDMLGEAALTVTDSARYWQAYRDALAVLKTAEVPAGVARPSLSIKLSALHPRYQSAHRERLWRELAPMLCEFIETAAVNAIDITIDAEEADRLELSLQLFAYVLQNISVNARTHIGLVVQAYGKRAWSVVHWLDALAQQFDICIKLRLVKGAYWDSEIKRAQQRGLTDYPVFTHKAATDISYLACARFLLERPTRFFPQFATHNAVTIAAILHMQPNPAQFEFQRLQGMGEILHRLIREQYPTLQQRIYAPIGEHRELLPYLVRRILENGANTSFMHHLHDNTIAIDTLAAHPFTIYRPEKQLLPPTDIWPQRRNSAGAYLHSQHIREFFFGELKHFRAQSYSENTSSSGEVFKVVNPSNGDAVGSWSASTNHIIDDALRIARENQYEWQQTPVETRSALLEKYADLLEENRAELIALMARETGKTIENGIDEVREAIDFCRYYAQQARTLFTPQLLPSVVGEHNELGYSARGIFACISPWNFPLAIFTGQIVAALSTGNAVIAKPAEQATLTAQLAIRLMYAAGIPREILHCAVGRGESVGRYLCAHTNIDGIVFTGGWETARAIQQKIAQREGAMIPFIAETAGINALIADSSAQPQQLVNDIVRSAFDSAGQRCSALRILLLPKNCATEIETLLFGALQELQLGDPLDWSTDIGPVIDGEAKSSLENHLEQHRSKIIFQLPTPSTGNFVAPAIIRLQHIAELQREAFGPILHIVHYHENKFDALADDINALGYGLTCGIHSRNLHRAEQFVRHLRVGNIYVNRDIIGAVVGAQPFGGCGKSGTGPKAGGPNYLLRFVNEKTVSINTAAIGGDYDLMTK